MKHCQKKIRFSTVFFFCFCVHLLFYLSWIADGFLFSFEVVESLDDGCVKHALTHTLTHSKNNFKIRKKKKNAHDGTRQDCPMSLKKKNFVFVVSFQFFELGSIKTANRFSNENGERKDALDWIENVVFFSPWRKRTRNFEIFNNNKSLNMVFKKMFFCFFF